MTTRTTLTLTIPEGPQHDTILTRLLAEIVNIGGVAEVTVSDLPDRHAAPPTWSTSPLPPVRQPQAVVDDTAIRAEMLADQRRAMLDRVKQTMTASATPKTRKPRKPKA